MFRDQPDQKNLHKDFSEELMLDPADAVTRRAEAAITTVELKRYVRVFTAYIVDVTLVGQLETEAARKR
jgi:hypothetical protein